MEKIIGRNFEYQQLTSCCNSSRSEFVIIFGRRRIGKTFLVRSFFNDKFDFQYTGARNMSPKQQLENFAASLQKYSKSQFPLVPKDWYEAFRFLQNYLESLPKQRRKIIFIDEMPWIDSPKSLFVNALENFWNGFALMRDDIVLVACGSATSWMSDKLVDNQGGLHNRITRKIYLRPFTLNECKEYLKYKKCNWDIYQTIQCYMILGGVPFYYSLLDPQLSFVQNIDYLFFKQRGVLNGEFNELYNALFSNSDKYITVVRALSQKREGLSRNEVIEKTKLSGGGLSKILDNLEKCDFITGYTKFKNPSKNTIYKLTDFYTLFYFRFIENVKTGDDEFWAHNFNSPKIYSWQGYTFELVCMMHIGQIKQKLGISGMATSVSTWRSNNAEENTQIDLLIDRSDRTINVCEIKFSSEPYTISKDYESKLRMRNAIFRAETKTTKALAVTFVTVFGVVPNVHSGIVQNEVTAEDLLAG
ncbi:MAG: ATP-binding protein [Bacteroidales bacterium]|nr:ATP-binding protein [Bacteroidales bacterium]